MDDNVKSFSSPEDFFKKAGFETAYKLTKQDYVKFNYMDLNKESQKAREYINSGKVEIHVRNNKDVEDMAKFFSVGYYPSFNIDIKSDVPDTFKTLDGIVYTDNGKTLAYCPAGKSGHLTIPDGVETIGPNAFANSRLNSVTMPETLTEVKDKAFQSSKINVVQFGGNVKDIGRMAFSRCSELEAVYMPPHLKNLGDKAFYSCNKLRGVHFYEGVESIGNKAFFGSKKLDSVTIPKSVKNLGEYSFSNVGTLNIKGDLDDKTLIMATRSMDKDNERGYTKISKDNKFFFVPKDCDPENKLGDHMFYKSILTNAMRTARAVFRETKANDVLDFIKENALAYSRKLLSNLKIKEFSDFIKEVPQKFSDMTKLHSENVDKKEAKECIEEWLAKELKKVAEKLETRAEVKNESKNTKGEPAKNEIMLEFEDEKSFYEYIESKKDIYKDMDKEDFCKKVLTPKEPSDGTLEVPRNKDGYTKFSDIKDRHAEMDQHVTKIKVQIKDEKEVEKMLNLLTSVYCEKADIVSDMPDKIKSIDRGIYTNNGKTFAYSHPHERGVVRVAEGTENIGRAAFIRAELDRAIIPDSVKKISEKAFAYSAISSIELGKGVMIEPEAFKEASIGTLSISRDTLMDNRAFDGCKQMNVLSIDNGVKELKGKPFENHSFKSIDIPGDMKKIDNLIGPDTYDFCICGVCTIPDKDILEALKKSDERIMSVWKDQEQYFVPNVLKDIENVKIDHEMYKNPELDIVDKIDLALKISRESRNENAKEAAKGFVEANKVEYMKALAAKDNDIAKENLKGFLKEFVGEKEKVPEILRDDVLKENEIVKEHVRQIPGAEVYLQPAYEREDADFATRMQSALDERQNDKAKEFIEKNKVKYLDELAGDDKKLGDFVKEFFTDKEDVDGLLDFVKNHPEKSEDMMMYIADIPDGYVAVLENSLHVKNDMEGLIKGYHETGDKDLLGTIDQEKKEYITQVVSMDRNFGRFNEKKFSEFLNEFVKTKEDIEDMKEVMGYWKDELRSKEMMEERIADLQKEKDIFKDESKSLSERMENAVALSRSDDTNIEAKTFIHDNKFDYIKEIGKEDLKEFLKEFAGEKSDIRPIFKVMKTIPDSEAQKAVMVDHIKQIHGAKDDPVVKSMERVDEFNKMMAAGDMAYIEANKSDYMVDVSRIENATGIFDQKKFGEFLNDFVKTPEDISGMMDVINNIPDTKTRFAMEDRFTEYTEEQADLGAHETDLEKNMQKALSVRSSDNYKFVSEHAFEYSRTLIESGKLQEFEKFVDTFPQAENDMQKLYEQFGDNAVVSAIVNDWYDDRYESMEIDS